VLCKKKETDFWEATYREINIALTSAMKFEQEHTLPMLAVQATWVAVQMGNINAKGKPLSIEKLLGRKDTAKGEPMTRSGMMAEALVLQDFHNKQMEKKKKEEEGVV
jgi:hypothetical protein